MWQRASTGDWFVTMRGKQINLGRDYEAAEKEYGRLLVMNGLDAKTDISLAQLVQIFWSNPRAFKSTSTKDGYEWLITKIPAAFASDFKASELRAYHVHTFLEDCGITTDASQNKAIAQISRIMNWAVRQGYLRENPIRGIERPTVAPREHFLRPDQLCPFLAAIESRGARIVARFMLETGARVVEARKLTVNDIVFEEHRIILPYRDSKGKKKKRVIFLNACAEKILRDAHAEEIRRFYAGDSSVGPVFRNSRGTIWTANALNMHFRKAGEKLELPFKMCGTILRHSFAYLRLSHGQDVATVAKLLGHSSTNMVYRVYGHLCEGPILEHAAEAVKIPGV